MRHEQVREFLRRQPFQPFFVHLPEGRAVEVWHHDFALLSPDGRILIVFDRDGIANYIDLQLVASIPVNPPSLTPAHPQPTSP